MHIPYLVLFFLLSCISSFAQLPPFRFVGLPEQHRPTGNTVLMNDRILIYSDDETSTWNERRQRHYIYHRVTNTWSPLPHLDTLSERRTISVCNDSLICVNTGPFEKEFVIWNVDTDEMVVRGAHTGFGGSMLAVHPGSAVIQVEQDPFQLERFSVIRTSIPDGTINIEDAVPPESESVVLQIWSDGQDGIWLQTRNAIWWTDDFGTYKKAFVLSPIDNVTVSDDGKRVHVWRTDNLTTNDTVITLTDPLQPPAITEFPNAFTSSMWGKVDAANRVWSYSTGVADGFYVAANETPQPIRYARFDQRARLIDLHLGPGSWAVANTYAGIMVSEDEGVTWRLLPLPHRTYAVIDSLSSLQSVEVGGVMITATEVYHQQVDQSTFEIIGTDADLRRSRAQHWHHRNGSLLGIDGGKILFSDARGITYDPSGSSRSNAIAFVYRDTVYVRWTSSSGVTGLNIGHWTPGSTTLPYDRSLTSRFKNVYAVQEHSKGTWFGGYGNQWFYSSTGNVENLQTANMTTSLCSGFPLLIYANEINDSLVVLVGTSNACGVIAHPLNDLSSSTIRRRGTPFSFFGRLIRGHDQQLIGIASDPLSPEYVSDSVYILSPDMMSAKIRRFENITESRVFDIAYDSINRVYYALTERGLYRSDPVVTSVDEHVRRPSSIVLDPSAEIPLQTSWYTTLGQRIEPPTNSGVYLKIEFDDKGQMVTEKVLIP